MMVCRFLILALLLAAPATAAAGPEGPEGKAWDVEPRFETARKKEQASIDISGAVCVERADGDRRCYAADDESPFLQSFKIKGETLKTGAPLLFHDGLKEPVIDPGHRAAALKRVDPDIEALAYADNYVYAVGSHGPSRGECRYQDSAFLLYRFPVLSRTGAPETADVPKPIAKRVVKTKGWRRLRRIKRVEISSKLRGVIRADPMLAAKAEACLHADGANIEGAAVYNKRLFLGFRAPVVDGSAVVLSAPIEQLFDEETVGPKATSHALGLGAGFGVRAMESVEDGLLILAGPIHDEQPAPAIWHWDPDSPERRPGLLAQLADAAYRDDLKAEGLLALRKTRTRRGRWKVLVLFDKAANGKPRAYRIDDPN